MGEVGQTNIGLTYKPSDICNDGIVVLRSSNIKNNEMDYNDIVKVNVNIPDTKKCYKGDILICARNGSKRLVGKSAIIDQNGMTFGAFMAIYRSQFNCYIQTIISSPYFRNSLLQDTGTTTINQITQDMLKEFVFPLPPLAEQKRIVARVEELFDLVDLLSSGKKIKLPEKQKDISEIKVIANNVIAQPMFDIESVGLAARARDNIDDETINEAKRQVQAFYEKKN